jgi:uncharacterized membrane protein HdeD (DUF308 family)
MSATIGSLPGMQRRLSMVLTRGWWRLLVRGLVAIAFGILTWTWPGVSLSALMLLFALYATADGVLGVWTAVAGRKDHQYWWLLLIAGLVGIAVGVLTLAAPGLVALALLLYIAIWAIAKGGLEIVTAIRLRKEIEGEWLLLLAGAASVVFGAFLLARPVGGALMVLWLIGAYAVVIGVLLVLLALKARSLGRTLAHP